MKKYYNEIKRFALTGGVAFGICYLTGYVYLLKYFDNFGSHLIPIRDVPSSEIAIMGIMPILIYSLFVFLFWVFLKKANLKFKRRILYKTKIGRLLILTISVFVSLFVFISVYASFIFKLNYTYDSINTLSFRKIPVIELIYNTQLINNKPPESVSNIEEFESFTATGITIDELYSKNGDVKFTDQLNKVHFSGNFVLYFESEDNYFVSPLDGFFEPYVSGIVLTGYPDDSDQEIAITDELGLTFGGSEIDPYRLIVVPKRFVESIKYHNISFNQKSSTAK